jgi:type IV pilus assembly protein PilB
MNKNKELLKKIYENKLISLKQKEEIEQKIEIADKNLEEIILDKKLIDSEELTKLKAEIYNFPYENLLDREVDSDTLNIIPYEAAENYQVVCFNKNDKVLKIGILDPENYKAFEALNFLAKEEGYKAKYYLVSEIGFEKVFKQYKDLKKEISTALKSREEESEKDNKKKDRNEELENIIKSAPVTKMVSVIIRHAVEGRASDIHIEPTKVNSRIRYRIDGILYTSLVLPKNIHQAIVARIKVLSNLKLDETRIPQDGRFKITTNNKDIDFRVSILPLIGEEKVVMRILDTSKKAPELTDLGYDGRELRIINENIKKTNGMFLVTGPTGSGKSTTLFSILNMLNKEGVNISTLEDPVEYFIQGVNQSQVKPEINFTFASGLRSLLRQDPDIIMVGEVRDSETAELAIHASLTGHFVLSTLHTNSSMGTIPRLIDMHVEPFLLGSTLNIIVAQRLARRLCDNCKKEAILSEDLKKELKEEILKIPEGAVKEAIKDFKGFEKTKIYEKVGCSRCGNTGYSGRVAIAEVLDVNDSIKNLIMDGKRISEESDVVKEQNFTSLRQNGLIKILKGVTTYEEVLRVTST